MSGKIEKITSKVLDDDLSFKRFFYRVLFYRDPVEYYILVNGEKYKLPDKFIGSLQKGKQVTLVVDRKGINSIELEVLDQ